MGLVLQGTLAPIKHLNCCVNMYSGQKYAPLWHSFANNVVHMHLQKIALNMPMEHCNHCRYHLPNFIPTPLTLSLTYLLHGASTVSSLSLIVSQSLCVSYPVPWGKTNCQLHKSQNYCLKTLLGFLECQKNLFIIVIPGLLLIFGMNYGIFLALKPVLPLYFTLRLMGKVSAPIAHLNKSYMHTFTTNLCQHG